MIRWLDDEMFCWSLKNIIFAQLKIQIMNQQIFQEIQALKRQILPNENEMW